MHALCDCEHATTVWDHFISVEGMAKFFSLGLQCWLEDNIRPQCHIDKSWPQQFGVTLWSLWRARNDFIFKKSFQELADLAISAASYTNTIIHELTSPVPIYVDVARTEFHIAWHPPPPHTVKVNVDGSFRSSSGMAACGGLIRDSHGVLITGFSCNLGACTSIWAEAWSLYLGMKLARTLRFSTVVFEMDSQTIVNCVNLRRSMNAFLSPIF